MKTSETSAGSVTIEDCIMQKGLPAAAGSKILEGFVAPFEATVVTRLQEAGYTSAGRAEMDEFGIDRLWEEGYDVPSGAVRAVADGVTALALCNDVFGKQRRQAAENGVCYIRPTYGTVSRYGLIPAAASMDQIGIVCGSLPDGFELLSAIAGHDSKDGAMFPQERYHYQREERKVRIGIPSGVISKAEEPVQAAIRDFSRRFDRVEIELKYVKLYRQVMYILCCAEISNNINRYDGIKFGCRTPDYRSVNDLYVKTRTEAFGLDAKLAAIMGAMALSQDQYLPYYEKSMRLRRLIKESLLFDEYDVIVLPTKISGNRYENLALFSLSGLAGLPSVSFSYQGQGMQLVARATDENALLTAWEATR